MALHKAIKWSNGLILNYHRIESVTIKPNNNVLINVKSYLNEDVRRTEQGANQPYYDLTEIIMPYKENCTIKDCYDYIKIIDCMFKDAVNA